MTFTINTIEGSVCSHVRISATINGVSRTVTLTRAELQDEPTITEREQVLNRIRSYCKENNLTTPSAIKSGLEGQTFKV